MVKKAKILYDPQVFDIQDYGGISRYFANLISGVQSTEGYEALVPLVYSSNYYIRKFPQLLNHRLGKTLLKSQRKRDKWNKVYAALKTKSLDYDLLHATYYNPYFMANLKKPLVITIHDMIYENYPDLFPESPLVIEQKRKMIESASLIIAISEYTKTQILRFYPDLSTPIKIVYHGLPELHLQETNEDLPANFILYVGDRNAQYKNFKPFIEAIAPIINTEPDLRLICAGGGAFTEAESVLLRQYGITERVSQVNASDSLLKQLYIEAIAFIYPSIEEGFGLPLLEAFSNGCAVACANGSSLPEVGGDAVTYFDPLNQESMRNSILSIILDSKLREAGIKKGFEQLSKFSFESSLSLTLDCYKSLL